MRLVHLGISVVMAAPSALGVLPPPGTTATSGCENPGTSQFEADDFVSLPYIVEGEEMPPGELRVAETGGYVGEDDLSLSVVGPFVVEGDTSPLQPGEVRSFSVTFTGNEEEVGIYSGEVTFSSGEFSTVTDLYGVVGDDELPQANWSHDSWGSRVTLPLPSAPFPHPGDVWTDPSVFIFLPEGLTDQGDVGIVTHLHGWYATLAGIVDSMDLAEQHHLSGRDAVLIVPQGPVNAASGDFGKLMDPGGYGRLVRDVVSILYRDGYILQPRVGDIMLTSHSGGYQAAARILEVGGLPVFGVHLFDSLYDLTSTFFQFVMDGGVLRSSYTSEGGTIEQNLSLQDLLDAESIPYGTSFRDDDLLAYDVGIGSSPSTHMNCVRDERNFARWLARSGIRPRPSTPPELRYVMADGDRMEVAWIEDGWPLPLTYQLETSEDGNVWEVAAEGEEPPLAAPSAPWVRLVTVDPMWGTSDPSDVYGGTGAEWLVVDGFDRVLGGSYNKVTHPFAAKLGNALGASFSVASSEAIVSGEVDLVDYPYVLWLLGDEGVSDLTFDPAERLLVEDYVAVGGGLIVSGAEVGYATNRSWLSSVLHTTYVADDAGVTSAGGFQFGVDYPEDYPDVLEGDTHLWNYSSGGAAAVGWNRQVVVVGFPLETIDRTQLIPALDQLTSWLEETPGSRACYAGSGAEDPVCLLLKRVDVLPASHRYPPPLAGHPRYQAPLRWLDISDVHPNLHLTSHFTVGELAPRKEGPLVVLQPHAVDGLQEVRDEVGRVKVIRGYLNPQSNHQQLGFSHSRHLYGDAFDLISTNNRPEAITTACYDAGASLAIWYEDHVHCDWRDEAPDLGFFGVSPGLDNTPPSDLPSGVLVGGGHHWSIQLSGWDEGVPHLEWSALNTQGEVIGLSTEPTFFAPEATSEVQLIIGRAVVFHVDVEEDIITRTAWRPGD